MNWFLGLLLLSLGSTSPGDKCPKFKECVFTCQTEECIDGISTLPTELQITFWNCRDECRYRCMRKIVNEKIKNGEKYDQYFGKWPFIRFFGLQEIASVIFSLLNLVAHVIGYRKLKSHIPEYHEMKDLYHLNFLISVWTWFWSAVFHSRDTYWTEKLDYFSAMLMILFGDFYSVIKVFNIDGMWMQLGLMVGLLCFYIAHVSYLLFYSFDYQYNIIACSIAAIAFNSIWLAWFFKHRKRTYAFQIPIIVCFSFLITGFEIFDFPPIFLIFDAHSLWHAFTVPLVIMWYRFLVADIQYECTIVKNK